MSAVTHLTPKTIGMLLIPPFFWAGNVVLGRLIQDLCPPITLNFLRWFAAFLLVLPLAWRVLDLLLGLMMLALAGGLYRSGP